MSKDKALKLALEALEKSLPRLAPYGEQDWLDSKAAITAINQARSAPVQKPVAWVREHELPLAPGDAFSWVETFVHKTPLYTTPPAAQRTWVGLTDEEKADLFEGTAPYYNEADYADAIEAKLKEKNT